MRFILAVLLILAVVFILAVLLILAVLNILAAPSLTLISVERAVLLGARDHRGTH